MRARIKPAVLVKAALVGALAISLTVIFGQGCGKFSVGSETSASLGLSPLDFDSQLIAQGKAVWDKNCVACHGAFDSATAKRNRTVTDIRAALGTVPEMSVLKGKITDQEIVALAKALEKRVGGNPFACANPAEAPPRPLQRLTRRELINTVLDFTNGAITRDDIQAELQNLPEGALVLKNPFDTGSVDVTTELINGYHLLAKKVGNLVAADATRMSKVVGDTCFTVAAPNDACVTKVIDLVGSRAYRRPLTAAEKTDLLGVYRLATDKAQSLSALLQFVMQSSNFLYRLELNGVPVQGVASHYQLTDYEFASRLSYLITGSMPDAQLMQAAATGVLKSSSGLYAEVDRLLQTSKAKVNARYFYDQWLALGNTSAFGYSPTFMSGLTATTRDEMIQETFDFMDHLIWVEKGDFKRVMTSDIGFVKTDNLAKIYGVPKSTAPDGRVTFTDPARKGLLTRAAMLADGIDTTRPIHRGIRVRRNILCDEIAPPDPSKLPDGSLVLPPPDPKFSTRQRYEAKTGAALCMNCHQFINPLGFAFENFDSLGRKRDIEKVLDMNGTVLAEHRIDARAEPNLEIKTEPAVEGGAAMGTAVASTTKGPACLVRRYHTFAMGRVSENSDGCTTAKMYDALNNGRGSIVEMMRTMALDPSFRTMKLAN